MKLPDHLVTVRRATPDDRAALRAMQALSISVLGVEYYTPEQIAAFICHVGTMDDFLLHEGTYYVAETPEEIVASGGWSRRHPNYANATRSADKAAMDAHAPKVRSLYVHPAFARRGIASRLMDRAEDEARAAGYAAIELTATLSGEPLYLKRGYVATRRLDLVLPDGLSFPAVHMAKPLAVANAAPTARAAQAR